MELTKEQIKYIDHRLENEGVKYWDIRIEMLDHIVSDVEKNLTKENTEYQFKEIVQNTFVSIGWKENFNGSNFPETDKGTWKSVNNEYRKMFFQGFINFFKSFTNVGILLCFTIVFVAISNYLNFKIFKRISLILFILPIISIIIFSIKIWKKKYGKSIQLNYGAFYFSFPLLMINLPIQFLKDFSESTQKWFLIIVIPLYYIYTYSGYKVYQKAISKVEKIRKVLLS